jgi:putative DNA methylase
VLKQVTDAYRGIAELLTPSDAANPQARKLAFAVPGAIAVHQGNAGNLKSIKTASQTSVTVDPPYYDNVMYAELSDYFYVWEKRTLGLIWPEFFQEELTDKKNEAVANPARFKDAGSRRKELATADYEAKMTAIFEECHRVLRGVGVLTVMFTHKKAEAWDTLGMALMEAGFTIETSWPVPTESDVSLHQAKKNAAQSTIFLVCRKRPTSDKSVVFYEDIEADVRAAARDALQRFSAFGIDGVDLLLSTYGPALSVISSNWPVYSSEADPITGNNRLLKPEEALATAREELVRLQRQRLIGRSANLDGLTDFALLAWETFKAREFPFDEARRLALAVGGLDVDTLARAKLLTKKSGTVVLLEPSQRLRRKGDAEAALPGVRLDATSFEYLVDAVHTALHITKQDGPATAKQFLERAGLTRDARFLAAFQGFLNAMPRTRSKGEWVVPEAGLLDTLAVFLDGVSVPEPEEQREKLEQGGFAFDGDSEE